MHIFVQVTVIVLMLVLLYSGLYLEIKLKFLNILWNFVIKQSLNFKLLGITVL